MNTRSRRQGKQQPLSPAGFVLSGQRQPLFPLENVINSSSFCQPVTQKEETKAQQILRMIRVRAMNGGAPEWFIIPISLTQRRDKQETSTRLITAFLNLDRDLFVEDLFRDKGKKTPEEFLCNLLGLESGNVLRRSKAYIRICFGQPITSPKQEWLRTEPEIEGPFPPVWLSSLLLNKDISDLINTYKLLIEPLVSEDEDDYDYDYGDDSPDENATVSYTPTTPSILSKYEQKKSACTPSLERYLLDRHTKFNPDLPWTKDGELRARSERHLTRRNIYLT